jgi:hypothetical protein
MVARGRKSLAAWFGDRRRGRVRHDQLLADGRRNRTGADGYPEGDLVAAGLSGRRLTPAPYGTSVRRFRRISRKGIGR